jgi:hypothetical protein
VLCGIGGGSGHLLRAILDAAPNARGVLFDLAHVIEEAGIASERLTFPAGDFFRDELPACDAYLLMEISTTGETKSPPPSSGRFGGPPRRAPGCW